MWKHIILLTIMKNLLRQSFFPTTFRYFETHCGNHSYTLSIEGEWQNGIGRFSSIGEGLKDHPYFHIQDGSIGIGSIYHGSWSLAATYLRQKQRTFRFTLCDISADVETSVREFATQSREVIEFRRTDGFTALKNEIHQQDLIFIDPTYSPPDSPNDWQACADISAELALSSTPFIIWYPIFEEQNPQRLVERAASPGYEVRWKTESEKKRMTGAGMVIGNCSSSFDKKDLTVLKQVGEHLDGRFHIRKPRT